MFQIELHHWPSYIFESLSLPHLAPSAVCGSITSTKQPTYTGYKDMDKVLATAVMIVLCSPIAKTS